MAYLLNTYRAAKYVRAADQTSRIIREVRSGPANRHHRFFEADWSDGSSWMLKQPLFSDDATRFGIANEGFVHGLLTQFPEALPYLVPWVAYDPQHQILVTERLPNHRPVADALDGIIAHARLEQTAGAVGCALAVLHGCLGRLDAASLLYAFHAFKPNLLVDNAAFFNRVLRRGTLRPPIQRLLIALMRDPKVEAALRSLSDSWRFNAVIHGDATARNVLVRLDDPVALPRLCDWEFAGQGDPRWDAASFFQELLRAYGRMKLTVAMFTRAAEAFHRGYLEAGGKAPAFEPWFADLLQLSAAGYLELTLANALENDEKENDRFLSEAAQVEFLVEHVLTGNTFL